MSSPSKRNWSDIVRWLLPFAASAVIGVAIMAFGGLFAWMMANGIECEAGLGCGLGESISPIFVWFGGFILLLTALALVIKAVGVLWDRRSRGP